MRHIRNLSIKKHELKLELASFTPPQEIDENGMENGDETGNETDETPKALRRAPLDLGKATVSTNSKSPYPSENEQENENEMEEIADRPSRVIKKISIWQQKLQIV